MPAARYVTLRDYLRVLRRYWILITLIAAVGAAAGLANSERQKPLYEATAEVNFQDPTQDLSIVGLGSSFFQTPAAIAAVNAQTASSPSVSRRVASLLGRGTAAQRSASTITASVSSSTGLLVLTATSPHAAFAARLANTVASVLIAQDNAQVRAEFTQVVGDIQRRVATLTRQKHASSSSTVNTQLAFYEDELARLQTVSGFATTAELSTRATVPSAPSSPNRTRSTVLGLVLGLLLGILAAFARDSSDRRLRTSRDVTESLPFPVIGHVRAREMGRVVRVPKPSDKDGWADLESFRILRRNLETLFAADDAHHTVLVTSAVPEEGKTTVASSLAVAMASAGKTTLLVDCDLRRPALAKRLELPGGAGLTDYLSGEASPQEILQSVPLLQSLPGADETADARQNGSMQATAAPQFSCIASGSPHRNTPELLGSALFREFMQEIREAYDIVIFDSSPILPVSDTLEMLPLIGTTIVCVRHGRTTRDQALAARAALARVPDRPTGVVVTGIKPRNAESELYAYAYDYS